MPSRDIPWLDPKTSTCIQTTRPRTNKKVNLRMSCWPVVPNDHLSCGKLIGSCHSRSCAKRDRPVDKWYLTRLTNVASCDNLTPRFLFFQPSSFYTCLYRVVLHTIWLWTCPTDVLKQLIAKEEFISNIFPYFLQKDDMPRQKGW